MIALLVAGLTLTAAHAGCPATPDSLVERARQAEEAFARMNAEDFQDAVASVQEAVPCLDTPLTPPQAARVHLVLALDAFLKRDEPATIAAFQAVEDADPELDLGDWLPEHHPLTIERRYASRFDEAPPTPLRVPGGVTLWIDGQPGTALVPARPAVVQLLRDSQLTESVLWRPDTPLPDGLAWVEPSLSPRLRRRLWLGGGSLAAAGATTGLLLWSSNLRDAYLDPDTPYAQLDDIERRTRGSSLAAIGAAAITAGLGTTLVVLW